MLVIIKYLSFYPDDEKTCNIIVKHTWNMKKYNVIFAIQCLFAGRFFK